MISLCLAVLAALQVLMAVAAWRSGGRGRLTALLGCALAYDSAVIAAGRVLGEGDVLEALSVGRFAVHAFGTPLVLPCAALALRWGGRETAASWACAGVLTVLGVSMTLPGLELEPRRWADTLRYADAEPGGFPVAAVSAIVLLFLIGLAAWIRRRLPWIALGALAVFVASAAAFAAPPLGNLGEALMLASLLYTLHGAERGRGPRPPARSVDPTSA
ncbi:hypothetical protein [Streptomyces sp. NPDC058613]|uniref:hypothetical protein n=1 Tax=Streptomyces sp. NPDC058613 TaxID=3346556 RepID=UPI00365BAAC2